MRDISAVTPSDRIVNQAAAEAMHQVVIDHLTTRIFWKDKNSVYLGCNLVFAQDAGFERPDQIIGLTDLDFPWAETEAADYRADDARVMRSGQPKLNFEEPQMRTNGEWTWLRTSKVPLFDTAGKLVGVLGTYDDITEGKEAEIAMVNARDKADRANQAKSEFLATMSHEMRTPLNALLGFVELLQRGVEEGEVAGIYNAMAASGQSLRALIDDVLDLSKIEDGLVTLSNNSFNPTEFVQSQFDGLKSIAQERGLGFSLTFSEPIPKTVVGDSARWGQVFRNLAGNALKFTESGEVTVRLSSSTPEGEAEYSELSLEISDTGPGISDKEQESIFGKFARLDTSNARKYGGTGLGLYVSRQLCRLLGGDVELKSEKGVGSTFHARIRCRVDHERKASSSSFSNLKGVDKELATRFPLNILIVDDIKENRFLATAFLKALGYEPSNCGDAFSAYDQLCDQRPDLVLMDVEMPGRTGLELTQMIRSNGIDERGEKPPLWIVGMTAGVLPEDKQRCFEAGMNDYLPKPFSLPDIENAVKRAAETKSRQAVAMDWSQSDD